MNQQAQDDTKPQISRETLINPPPNHNPLIGLLHGDTLINIHDSLSVLQDLTANGELNLSDASNNGLYFLLCCIKDALRFEIDQRDKITMTSHTCTEMNGADITS